jgi:hypothetical protein
VNWKSKKWPNEITDEIWDYVAVSSIHSQQNDQSVRYLSKTPDFERSIVGDWELGWLMMEISVLLSYLDILFICDLSIQWSFYHIWLLSVYIFYNRTHFVFFVRASWLLNLLEIADSQIFIHSSRFTQFFFSLLFSSLKMFCDTFTPPILWQRNVHVILSFCQSTTLCSDQSWYWCHPRTFHSYWWTGCVSTLWSISGSFERSRDSSSINDQLSSKLWILDHHRECNDSE